MKNNQKRKALFKMLFAAYTAFVLAITLNENLGLSIQHCLICLEVIEKDVPPSEDRVILLPFKFGRGYLRHFLYNLFGNFALFIPLGTLAALCFNERKRKLKLLGICCGLSLLIEFFQFFLPYRQSDINDLMLNTFGALCGILLASHLRTFVESKN